MRCGDTCRTWRTVPARGRGSCGAPRAPPRGASRALRRPHAPPAARGAKVAALKSCNCQPHPIFARSMKFWLQKERGAESPPAADRADGGGQYHGMYVAKDAVAKSACLSACLCSACPRVCLRTGIRLRLCLRVCVGRIRRVSCVRAANSWPSARTGRRAHRRRGPLAQDTSASSL